MTATITDLTEASRKAWLAATPAMRTAMLTTAGNLVDYVGRVDSTALGMVQGIVVAQGVEPRHSNATIVGLVALAHGWTVE